MNEITTDAKWRRAHSVLLQVGIDVGSTTTKVVVLEPESETLLFSRYR